MVHIQDLPMEILYMIFSFVLGRPANPLNDKGVLANIEPSDDRTHEEEAEEEAEKKILEIMERDNLRQMCLVSATFRDIAQPLLFHSFQCESSPSGDLRKTIYFAKAIYRRPKLGEYVKEFKFKHLLFRPVPERLPADDAKLCKLAIQALELGDQEKRWISLVRTYDFSVIIALVVVKLPNLRGLTLKGFLNLATRFKPLFDRDPSFLSQLRFLHIKGTLMSSDLALYEDFFTYPRLQHLRLEYCNLNDASFPSAWTPGSLAAETLVICDSCIDSGEIRKLMQAWGLEAAHPHKETLEYFHVELARSATALNDIQKYLSSCAKFGSFREFTALKTIMVPHAYLPVHPELPRSLEQIDITDCNSSIQNMAQNIAKDARKGLYPELLHVRVLTLDVRAPISPPQGQIPLLKTPTDFFYQPSRIVQWDQNYDDEDSDDEDYDGEDYGDYGLGFGDDDDNDDDNDDDDDDDDDDDELSPGDMNATSGVSGLMDQLLPELYQILMEQAMRDADFAHLRPPKR
ncbi:hypothetical protein N7494_010759 [Penicillium frequentans]|uniref:Uncharacterized protein n=1 Tax=Penicillium frequentans TaxID=3151616 RepID=A0AAD6CIH7_9EURO|nr:hypothetical protein N7494_010759 [Penicillium glabrum]